MSLIIGWLVKKIGIAFTIIFILGIYVAIIIAFIYFLHDPFIELRNHIQLLLNSVGSGASGSSVFLSHMFGYLNVVGFFDAFVTVLPFIESAIAFLLTRILWKYSLYAYKELISAVNIAANAL